jgi:hypothetical protein
MQRVFQHFAKGVETSRFVVQALAYLDALKNGHPTLCHFRTAATLRILVVSRLALILSVVMLVAGCGRKETPVRSPAVKKTAATNQPIARTSPIAPPRAPLVMKTNPVVTARPATANNPVVTTTNRVVAATNRVVAVSNRVLTATNPVVGVADTEHIRRALEEAEAIEWYNRGVRYAKGDGVSQDYAEAAKWFRAAAVRGHEAAQFNLAVLHVNGQGVPAKRCIGFKKPASRGMWTPSSTSR